MGFAKAKREEPSSWAGHSICAHTPVGKLEWKSDARGATIPYGLLFRCWEKGKDPHVMQYRSPVDSARLKAEWREAPPKLFHGGNRVTWTKLDDPDVPPGSVGTVLRHQDDGRVRVQFPKGEWAFTETSLRKVEFKPDDRVRQTSTGEEGIILHHPYDDEKGWLTDIGEANARFVQEADLAPAVELSPFKLGDSVRQKSTGEEGVILDLDPAKGWLTDIGGGRYVKEADLALTAFVVGEAGALELCVTPCGDDTLAAMLPAVKAEIKAYRPFAGQPTHEDMRQSLIAKIRVLVAADSSPDLTPGVLTPSRRLRDYLDELEGYF